MTAETTPPRAYAVYGTVLASRYPFTFNLYPSSSPPEIWFELVDALPLPPDWENTAPVFMANGSRPGSDMVDSVLEVGDALVARFDGLADFAVQHDRISCRLLDPTYAFAVELWLFGTVMALWLERRHFTVLHAAGVEVHGRGAAFLATNKGGKSSIALAMLRRGARLLTDDVLALKVEEGTTHGRAGYPQMRFWPEQARAFFSDTAHFERVQPGSPKLRIRVGTDVGTFTPASAPMGALYIPERVATDRITIDLLPASEALTYLIRHSYLAGINEALGMTIARFQAFSTLLHSVPLRRLRYPSGVGLLPDVCAAIERDLEALAVLADV